MGEAPLDHALASSPPKRLGERTFVASPTAALLARALDDWSHTVEIRAREDAIAGLGRYDVAVEGRSLWPPNGRACAALVSCCDEIASIQEGMDLFCQFAIAKKTDCAEGLVTVQLIIDELNRPRPIACED